MKVRRPLRHYSDLLLAVGLAVVVLPPLLYWRELRSLPVLALGLLATLPLAARRRQPLLVSLVVVASVVTLMYLIISAMDADGPENPPPVLVSAGLWLIVAVAQFSLFNLGLYATGRQFSLSACLLFASISAVAILGAIDSGNMGFWNVVTMFVALTFQIAPAWGAGVALRVIRSRRAEAREATKLLAEEEARNTRALEVERARIARDLHDVVSHALSVTLFQARGGRRVQATDPAAAQAAFDAIEHINAQALGDMRRMLNVLREADGAGESTSLPALRRLPQLVQTVQSSGVAVNVHVDGDLAQVPPGVDLSAYRIIQEALTNVIKHARAAQADIYVKAAATELEVSIINTGQSNPTSTGGGHGLNGIRERVAVLGGQFRAGPIPTSSSPATSGFAVQVTLPYEVAS